MRPDLPNDQRFKKAYSGTYWQIVDVSSPWVLRSYSLWDFSIDLPNDSHRAGSIRHYTLPGPNQSSLAVQERSLILRGPVGEKLIKIAVAIDRKIIEQATRDFAFELFPFVILLAVVLIVAAIWQLTYGLRPLLSLQKDLSAINQRQARRLSGQYPAELSDSVSAINQLLAQQETSLKKARQRASDLAHGLKTPLTVISNDAQALRTEGFNPRADALEDTVRVMQLHIDNELIRSRIVSVPNQRGSDANVNEITQQIVRTLKRIPKTPETYWRIEIPSDLTVHLDPHDLRELLGNILENAQKWSKEEIKVVVETLAVGIRISVLDDGPGVDEQHLNSITNRGLRLDRKLSGTGLGLSIVREVVEVYSLGLDISNRPEGGLNVSVFFPG